MYLYFYLLSGNFLLQKTKMLNQLFFIDQEKHSTLKVPYKFSNFNFHVFFIYLRAILQIYCASYLHTYSCSNTFLYFFLRGDVIKLTRANFIFNC